MLTAVAHAPLSRFSLDLAGFRVPRVLARRPSGEVHAVKIARDSGKLHVTPAARSRRVHRRRALPGEPPISSRWGDIGWES
jgi:hypothetical protein